MSPDIVTFKSEEEFVSGVHRPDQLVLRGREVDLESVSLRQIDPPLSLLRQVGQDRHVHESGPVDDKAPHRPRGLAFGVFLPRGRRRVVWLEVEEGYVEALTRDYLYDPRLTFRPAAELGEGRKSDRKWWGGGDEDGTAAVIFRH